MDIVRVGTSEYLRYIPIQGLDAVESALNSFSQGITRGARDTESHQLKAVGASYGGIAAGIYVMAAPHMQGSGSQFVRDIMESIRRSGGKWKRSFDYDGQGSFFKTTVEVDVLDPEQGIYSLGLHAAYVGDEPEIGLAEFLGVPRTLIWAGVEIETQPLEGDRFEFDFETILRKLDMVLGTDWATGEQAAEAMMTVSQYGESIANFILSKDENLVVSIRPGDVDHRFDYSSRRRNPDAEPLDTWSVEGSIFRGPLLKSYEKEGTMTPPTLAIDLRKPGEREYDTHPIWKPEEKEQVLKLRDEIAAALRP